ncbi:FAD/NAD(P)-binding domain-containing protein [Aspergillus uvarum CBS 121591]|uniref:FAD/NAD(P)-binding domain-containing protein n=1 Tax=Aspergillus uvarum CBS 121591 TaxID=1448315 RepID=A0A319D3I1_9EURO|nr:FAD/NAD(P)-binding domain-containing protein [Aspergillus uvarum CBS 121591]PYH85593.1 FAD/NAD(P)-binding domain-containing protein [Aspergillus uvarum CBS 121591]
MLEWPRIQFYELGDQSWLPGWLHQHEQFTLTQLWHLSIPGWSHGSLATQACTIIREHLPDVSSYLFVDLCAGAGGPTPLLERELNRAPEQANGSDSSARPVRFLLTDLFPHLEVWKGITKKQPNISYIPSAVDARDAPRYTPKDRKECRIFNICFHHFKDEDAQRILQNAVEEADSFVIFEITARDLWTCLCSPLVFFFAYAVTLRWYWWSPLHLFFTYVVPVAPVALWVDGLISCLRTRTPEEISALVQRQEIVDVTGWKFSSGSRTVQWPFITLHYYVGYKTTGKLPCTERKSGNRAGWSKRPSRSIIIIGAGLGGLTTAIACTKQNLDVLVLEKSPHLQTAGAGIQIPPNGTRVMRDLGLLPKLSNEGGAKVLEHVDFRRYASGHLIRSMPFGAGMVREFGAPWLIIHRADYHRVLYEEAVRLGVQVRLGVEVEGVDFEGPTVLLAGGERVPGDVVLGADGLWSQVRGWVVGGDGAMPQETGDLAYRAVIPRTELEALGDEKVDELCQRVAVTSYLGPRKHTIFYPVRGGTEFNLVLLRPDDLPSGMRREEAGVQEMRESYAGWDPTLVCRLLTEIQGRVALLGDACHPTLPYQAQGAAMAVEDGAVIGRLLGLLQSHLLQSESQGKGVSTADSIASILKLYEQVRKGRTTRNVRAARINRFLLHIADGIVQMLRDFLLRYMGVTRESDWSWLFSFSMRQTLGLDVIRDCEAAFEEWVRDSGTNEVIRIQG